MDYNKKVLATTTNTLKNHNGFMLMFFFKFFDESQKKSWNVFYGCAIWGGETDIEFCKFSFFLISSDVDWSHRLTKKEWKMKESHLNFFLAHWIHKCTQHSPLQIAIQWESMRFSFQRTFFVLKNFFSWFSLFRFLLFNLKNNFILKRTFSFAFFPRPFVENRWDDVVVERSKPITHGTTIKRPHSNSLSSLTLSLLVVLNVIFACFFFFFFIL